VQLRASGLDLEGQDRANTGLPGRERRRGGQLVAVGVERAPDEAPIHPEIDLELHGVSSSVRRRTANPYGVIRGAPFRRSPAR